MAKKKEVIVEKEVVVDELPQEVVEQVVAKEVVLVCSNCNDSGMRCSVCGK